MTWNELVSEWAERFDVPRVHARKRLRRLLKSLAAAVLKDGRVAIPGFGVFKCRSRKARQVRNPQTHELMQLPETVEIRFRKAKHFGRRR